jgi:hypothetical protein
LFRPAVTSFGSSSEAVGTPAIDSGLVDDVYLTIDTLPLTAGGPVTIGVTIQPLVVWLWIGGGVLITGCALAVVPVRRKRDRGVASIDDAGGGEAGATGVGESGPTDDELTERSVEDPVVVPVP